MSQQSGRRLYVGRLSQDATRKDVEDYFSTHGPIVDVRLMAGFCFLEFQELKVSVSFLLYLMREVRMGSMIEV